MRPFARHVDAVGLRRSCDGKSSGVTLTTDPPPGASLIMRAGCVALLARLLSSA